MTKPLRTATALALGLLGVTALSASGASAQGVTLRYLCHADANECDVARDLLGRFEKANLTIKVVVDKELAYGKEVGAPGQAAHRLRSYERNGAIFNATVNYVSQTITGTPSADQTYAKIQEEINSAVKK